MTAHVTDAPVRWVESAGAPHPECPKHMVFGPCGGVHADNTCELGDRRCPFVEAELVAWPGETLEPRSTSLVRSDGQPVIITDLRVRPFATESIAEVTRVLSEHGDAVLIGEHQNRPDFPPSFAAQAVVAAGGVPWVTLACRDRNRVLLEGEIEALAASPVAGVHCVTGDARAPSVRIDASQVFDLDGVRLAGLARRRGLSVSVAATPAAPPYDLRPRRLLEKQRAGAELCFVNHAGGSEAVARFVAAAHRVGVTIPFIPCVAVFTDGDSMAVLEGFPGLVLDHAERDKVLRSTDPRAAGVAAAVEQAQRMLAIDGVVGINLSGSATKGSEMDSAAIMAEVAGRLRAALSE